MYKKINDHQIVRISDGAVIPTDEGNTDYVDVMAWVAAGNTLTVVELPLVERRNRIWGDIKDERERRQGAGVKVGDYWFHSDANSRIQQLALVMLGANLPANVQWKTMSGAFVLMTQQLAGQIFAAEAASDIAIFAHAESLRSQVDASNAPEEIDIAAVGQGGWPPSFEDTQ